ncbi:hypothetical protein JW859_12290 [bacterium]|nr:hypothetical protein [bacterium]
MDNGNHNKLPADGPLELNITASRLYNLRQQQTYHRAEHHRRLQQLVAQTPAPVSAWSFAYAFAIPSHRPTY